MIKECSIELLTQCVDIAFTRNNLPESNCAYCYLSRGSIHKEFEFLITNPDCLMYGSFDNDTLIGIFGCFFNPDNKWVDCLGPFFKDEWNEKIAVDLFRAAKSTLTEAVRFNFYFDARNINCHNLMSEISAERGDNEFILLLKKSDYVPQELKVPVIMYEDKYKDDLIQLHELVSPDMYLSSDDILSSINKTRKVFCALDENGTFAGFGVLKHDTEKHCTAELFTVKEEKRGKGFGWALLNAVVDSAFNNHNADVIDLVVDKLNTHARGLYFSCGFKLSVENESHFIKV